MTALRLTALFLATLAACAPTAPRTAVGTEAPIEGYRADIDRLAGEWRGTYACPETGRSGAIVFRLAAGTDSVEAAVQMRPRPTADAPHPAAVALVVHHIAVDGRTFRGVLEPYDDPALGLGLETEFGGVLTSADRIEGSFESSGRQADTAAQCGRWWAERTSSP